MTPITKNQAIVEFMEKRAHEFAIQEYRKDIHSHLTQIELDSEESPVPQPFQQEILCLRSTVLSSLFEVCRKLSWSTSTFSIGVNVLDRYTSFTEVDPEDYKMVGYCCLWISSKYNENKPKGKLLSALVRHAGYESSYKATFLHTEFKILTSLGWDLSYSTSESFLELFLNPSEPNSIERRYGSIFLCELAEFNEEICFNYSPSSIAAAAMVITNAALLNNRPKQLSQEFDELEMLLVNSLLAIPPAANSKYLDKSVGSCAAEGGYPYKYAIIYHLIDLALFLDQQQQQFNSLMYKRSSKLLESPLQDFMKYPSFPISPIASPTLNQHKSSPSPPLYHVQPVSNSRKSSGTFFKSYIEETELITPGTTPKLSASSSMIVGGHHAFPHICSNNGQQIITPVQLSAPQPSYMLSQQRFPCKTAVVGGESGAIACQSTHDFEEGKCLKKRRI